MKQLFMFASQMLVAFACLAFTACSSDDDGDGGGANGNPLDNLVGSEWSCEYYNVGDNGEYEEGTIQLMFVSSDRAEEHVTYSGMEWNIDDDYVRYSGTNDNFYTYTVSGLPSGAKGAFLTMEKAHLVLDNNGCNVTDE